MTKAQDKEHVKKDQNQEDVAEGKVVPFEFKDTQTQKSLLTHFASVGSENNELFKTLQSTIKEGLDNEFIDKK